MAATRSKGKATRSKGSASKGSTKAGSAAKKNGKPASTPRPRTEYTKDLISKAATLSAEGKTTAQIAKSLKVPEHQALNAVRISEVKSADKIKTLTAAVVKKLRAEGVAWHTIAARCMAGGLPDPGGSHLKSLAKEAGAATTGRVKKNGTRKAGTRGGSRGR